MRTGKTLSGLSIALGLGLVGGCSSPPPRSAAHDTGCAECRTCSLDTPAERPHEAVWKPEERAVIHALAATYETGHAAPETGFLAMKDERGVPLAPRDPGASGVDGELLLGKPLPTTRFIDSAGDVFDLADLAGKKNVALVILRGFDGAVCMGCTAQTLAMTEKLAEFRKLEAEVFFVYPGRRETVNGFLDAVRDAGGAEKLPVPVLLDIDLAVVREMKIEDRLAKPTTIVLDKKGRVRFAHVGRSKTDRPSVPQLLEVIAKLSADPGK